MKVTEEELQEEEWMKERGGQRGWVNGLALGGGIFVCVVFSL